jgi:hypothetical protein
VLLKLKWKKLFIQIRFSFILPSQLIPVYPWRQKHCVYTEPFVLYRPKQVPLFKHGLFVMHGLARKSTNSRFYLFDRFFIFFTILTWWSYILWCTYTYTITTWTTIQTCWKTISRQCHENRSFTILASIRTWTSTCKWNTCWIIIRWTKTTITTYKIVTWII